MTADNAPKCPVMNFQRDGQMQMLVPSGRATYEPNSLAAHGERGVGQRGESAVWRRTHRMAAADELADRLCGAGASDYSVLPCAVDDRNFLSGIEIGLPG